MMEELDQCIMSLREAIRTFDTETTAALEGGAVIHVSKSEEDDIMPRGELFLISSFLLNFRQAATEVATMLEECRVPVETRRRLHNQRHLYAPKIYWSKW